MFRESLLETSATSVAQRSWATLMSFSLEMAGVATLIILPLLMQQAAPVFMPPPVPRTTSVTPDQIKKAVQLLTTTLSSQFDDGKLHTPIDIPKTIFIPKGPEPTKPVVVSTCDDCVYIPGLKNDLNTSGKNSVFESIFKNVNAVNTVKPELQQQKIRTSSMDPAMLVNRVEPVYPELAKRTRTQGTVRLAALIAKDGRIESLHVISGHPLLVNAAVDAVSRWRYRPTILNGVPVEVETQVEVNFILN